LKKPLNMPPKMKAARRPIAAEMKAAPKFGGDGEHRDGIEKDSNVWRNLKK